MADRNERGRDIEERLSKRFQSAEERGETERTDAPSKTSESASGTDSGETSVKERPSVLMYLPVEVRTELDIRFDELNARYKREHGEALEKNRDYYPAVVEAGLTGKDLEDILNV